MFGVGGGFGIVFSGVIVDHASWRWLFIVGAIPVAIAIVLIHRFVPESPIKTPSRIDVPGALLLSTGLVALLLALTEGENWGWTSARVGGLAAVAAVALAAIGKEVDAGLAAVVVLVLAYPLALAALGFTSSEERRRIGRLVARKRLPAG